MKASRTPLAAGLLIAATVAPAAGLAQNPPPVGRMTGFTGVEARGLSFQSGLGVKSVTEVAVPFVVIWPTSPRLSFDLGGRYATVSYTPDSAAKSTISGLTDIQARGVYQLVPNTVVFTVAVNLPTGKTQLTSAQVPAAGAIASDMIPFPVANFGSGFNVTSGLAVAVPVGGWAVGAAGSYRVNGGFTPFSDTSASYKAGGEFRLRLGADRIVGQSRVSLGFTFSSFAEDNFASSPIFQSGKRYIGQASWSFPIGNAGLAVYVWDLYRSAGSTPITGVTTQKRNVLTVGASGSLQLGATVLRPMVEFRNHSLGTGSLAAAGKLFSLGARYELPVNERMSLVPILRLDLGNVVNPSTSKAVSFTGWDAGVTLRATL